DGVPGLQEAATAGRALNLDRRIDRDRVWALERPLLEAACERSARDREFERYRRRRGEPLELFATYCATAERHGSDWRNWPEDAVAGADPGVEQFHSWLQWV